MANPTATSSRWSVPKRKLKQLVHDYSASAQAADLIYVNDKEEGILRKKKGSINSFDYSFQGKKIKDKSILTRIQH
jgi:DNA topoisomerase-1